MQAIDFIKEKYNPVIDINLEFLDTSFTIKTNNGTVAMKLTDYFARWITPAQNTRAHTLYAYQGEYLIDHDKLIDRKRNPGKSIKEAYYDEDDIRIILKKRTGVAVFVNGQERYVVGDLTNNIHQVVNVLDELFEEIFIENGYILVHASAVTDSGGNSAIIASNSGAGKSSVALALMDCGFKFVSNDRVLLNSNPEKVHLVGIPKKPRINPGTFMAIPRLKQQLSTQEISEFSNMDSETLWNLEHKYDVDIDTVFGKDKYLLEGNLLKIYFLNWKRAAGDLIVRKLDTEESIQNLRPQVLNLNLYRKQYRNPVMVEEKLAVIIKRLDAYSVEGAFDLYGLAGNISSQFNN